MRKAVLKEETEHSSKAPRCAQSSGMRGWLAFTLIRTYRGVQSNKFGNKTPNSKASFSPRLT